MPTHVVTEGYSHYIARKEKELNWAIPIFVGIILFFIGMALSFYVFTILGILLFVVGIINFIRGKPLLR